MCGEGAVAATTSRKHRSATERERHIPRTQRTNPELARLTASAVTAAREGFEPPEALTPQTLSRRPHSAALPPRPTHLRRPFTRVLEFRQGLKSGLLVATQQWTSQTGRSAFTLVDCFCNICVHGYPLFFQQSFGYWIPTRHDSNARFDCQNVAGK